MANDYLIPREFCAGAYEEGENAFGGIIWFERGPAKFRSTYLSVPVMMSR